MDNNNNSFAKNILLVAGFIGKVVAIAGAVFGVLKYLEKRKTEEFMDYYFDDDDDFDEALEDSTTQADEADLEASEEADA